MIDPSILYKDLLALQSQQNGALPPVDSWNPAFCGDMDLTICCNGEWVHEGSPIHRDALVKLFASVLKREGEEYFLVTPVEKWRIQVEDAPFYITRVERRESQQSTVLVFGSNTGDTIIAGADNPLWVDVEPITGEPRPYLLVRKNLPGLLSRMVFYQLAEWSQPCTIDGNNCHAVASMGQLFPLE